jgi:hypothetical protein
MRNIIGYTTMAIAGNGSPNTWALGERRTFEHEKVLFISQKVAYDPADAAILSFRVYAWFVRYTALPKAITESVMIAIKSFFIVINLIK